MTGVRRVLRLLAGAGLMVTAGVAINQILSDGKFSRTWLYASFGVAVLSLLYTEVWAAPAPPGVEGGGVRGGRRVYLRQLRASVRDMETVGVATPGEFVFRMRQVYVDVSVVRQVLHEAAREPFLGTARAGLGERRSLASVLRDAERREAARVLAVIGGPGSGKTTLARNTALELCEPRWWPWRRRLPVLLYLRDHTAALLAEDPPTLGRVAVSAGWLEGKVSARWLDRRLDRGRCVVLLDGLDEVADQADRGRVVAWVGRQIQRHPDNIYVVTSRPHGYESNPLPGAEVLQVRRFTGEQIRGFLRRWSYATESRARARTGKDVRAAADRIADDLLDRLEQRPALYDLAANPLLLTMTANVHRYRGQLPGNRAELYDEMCDVLLHRRSEARGLSDATGLVGSHKQHVVQHLALAMMRARVRDWRARDAARAIRRPLRQVPGDVTPEVFLEEARKGGLLVEREHGVYGFAHLSLQEYLTAAQLGTPRADTGLLTQNVDDPWWRETILLWASGNDATSVITTCLDRDTVPALALAFDCADQARTVEPAVRERLERLLASPAPGQSPDSADRLRFFAGIRATRFLSETIALSDTTALSARPVPRALYDSFVHEERMAFRHPANAVAQSSDLMSPAVGMQAGDAERFVAWLNTVTEDAVHRLPTPEELGDPAAALAADLTRHTVWARVGDRTVLHQPRGVPWPYACAPDAFRNIPSHDRAQLTFYLRLLALPPAERTRVEAWTRILTTALTHAPGPDLAPLTIPLAVAVAYTLGVAAAFDAALAREPDIERLSGLRHARTRALTRAIELSRGLCSDGARFFRPDLAPALDRALRFASGLPHEGDPDHALGLVREPGPDLEQVLDQVLGVDLTSADQHARAVNPTPALALPLDPVLDLDLFYGLDPVPTRALDLALDLAFNLNGGSQPEVLKLTLAAFRVVFTTLSLHTGRRALADSDSFLLSKATGSLSALQAPEDPARAVRHARDLVRQVADSPYSGECTDQALELLDGASELLTAIRDRTSPSDPWRLSCARTALLATIAVLKQAEAAAVPEGDLLLPMAIDNLNAVWQSLIALDHPDTDRRPANQILLITRTRP